jgi:hypothetical protein
MNNVTLEDLIRQLTANSPAVSQVTFETKEGELKLWMNIYNIELSTKVYEARCFADLLHEALHAEEPTVTNQRMRHYVNDLRDRLKAAHDEIAKYNDVYDSYE